MSQTSSRQTRRVEIVSRSNKYPLNVFYASLIASLMTRERCIEFKEKVVYRSSTHALKL